MTADREQTWRDAVENAAATVRSRPDNAAKRLRSLLAELEQAERRLGVLGQERDAIAEALNEVERKYNALLDNGGVIPG